jgi:hypothetical protein
MTCQARIGTSMAPWAPRRGELCGSEMTETVWVALPFDEEHPKPTSLELDTGASCYDAVARAVDVEVCGLHARSLESAERRGSDVLVALLRRWGIS